VSHVLGALERHIRDEMHRDRYNPAGFDHQR